MKNIAGKVLGIIVLVTLLILAGLSSKIMEYNDAGNVLFVQYPNGALGVYTDQGYKWQVFGQTTNFKKSNQFWFSNSEVDQNRLATSAGAIKIRFNDGGHGYISGSARYDLPTDEVSLRDIYSTYKSQESLERELIRTVVEKAVFMTGPLMSSKESAASKRPDLLRFVEDQASFGVYQATTKKIKVTDEITGEEKWVDGVELLKDPKNPAQYARQEVSPLQRFNVRLYNIAIGEIKYDEMVEKQINAQQQMIMEVQTAIATSKKAEQEALTVEQQGKANAAKAKWEQEVVKAKEVTLADQNKTVALTVASQQKEVAELTALQKKNVAELDAKQAELEKAAAISRGEGQAKSEELRIKANNYTPEKIAALVQMNKDNASALSNYKGALVPSVTLGGAPGSTTGADPLQTLIQLRSAEAIKSLGLDLTLAGQKTP